MYNIKKSLEKQYTVSMDDTGKEYVGLTLTWDYNKLQVTLSMPGYVKEALHMFQHEYPKKPQHSPHPFKKPKYGRKQQDTKPPPPIEKEINP